MVNNFNLHMMYLTQSPVLWPEFDRRGYLIRSSRSLLWLPIWTNPWIFMHHTCKFMWHSYSYTWLPSIQHAEEAYGLLINFPQTNISNTSSHRVKWQQKLKFTPKIWIHPNRSTTLLRDVIHKHLPVLSKPSNREILSAMSYFFTQI